jgi:hypothetical protein
MLPIILGDIGFKLNVIFFAFKILQRKRMLISWKIDMQKLGSR